MMAVMVGIIIQMMDDGILSPSSLFFIAVSGQVIVTALLHPQEFGALICGIVYYITIPSMYMLLQIYSIFNMNDVSWGTRETAPAPAAASPQTNTAVNQMNFLSCIHHLISHFILDKRRFTKSHSEIDGKFLVKRKRRRRRP